MKASEEKCAREIIINEHERVLLIELLKERKAYIIERQKYVNAISGEAIDREILYARTMQTIWDKVK